MRVPHPSFAANWLQATRRSLRLIFFSIVLFFLAFSIGAVVWQQTTQAQQSSGISFGSGSGIPVVDPSGLNRMALWVSQPTTVTFALYTLTPVDFTKRFANRRGVYPPVPLDVTGLLLAIQWSQNITMPTQMYWENQFTLFPAGLASGIYVIKATSNVGEATQFVLVSRQVLVLKRAAGGEIISWVSSLRSQIPVSNTTVTLYDRNGNSLTQGTSDNNGVAAFTVATGEPSMAVSVAVDGEVALAGFDWQWRSQGDYNYYYGDPSQTSVISAYLYSDRPIYRPGQKIYYQGFVRGNSNGNYTLLDASEPISITLRDPRSNVVATAVAHPDEYGTLSGEFLLGEEPPLGWYTIEMTVKGQKRSRQLRVEEYRKPEYQVTVNTPATHAIAGDNLPITVAADYYFGKPVANAQVRLTIYRTVWPRYGWYWWYPSPPSGNGQSPIAELTGVTGPDGKWNTTITVEGNQEWDALYSFEATVTDARNQPVQGSVNLPVHWNTLQLTLNTDKYGFRSDEPVKVNLRSLRHDNTPVANQQTTVRIIRDYWDATPETNAVPPQTVTTDGNGSAQITFTNVPQGWYRLEATSTDERGRLVKSNNYLWVFDPVAQDWWWFNNNEISILTDKESYAPGDTAQLLIQSRLQGMALLTLEREGVLSEQIVQLNGAVTAVNVPIQANHAPNVYAKIHLFKLTSTAPDGNNGYERNREGKLVIAQTMLNVPAVDKKLTIAISADAANYRPGGQATLTLQVTDATGAPVQARLGLALVDEAIYALQSDLSTNLFTSFWGQRANQLSTYDSLVHLPYYYGGCATCCCGGEAAPNPAPQPTSDAPTREEGSSSASTTYLRRLFADTAYWNPAITTDASGKATITITLPDNLTTWRVIAKAISSDTRLGEGKSSVLVTQEIIASPVLPRFAVVGDRFQTGLVGQNFSGAATSGNANMIASGLILLDGSAQTLNLADNGAGRANWTAVASLAGLGLVTSTLETSRGNDAIELPIPIKPFAVLDRWSAAGQANLIASESFTIPFNAVSEQTKLEVRLSPSLALGVLDGLDDLIDYPYGCVEQTMSRLLPSAVAAKTYGELGLTNPKEAELPKIITQGLQKLYGFQHNSGSWGWFYDDDGGVYLTSYVLFGLVSVQQAGFVVDSNVIERGFSFVDSKLAEVNDPTSKAWALYVKAVAGRGNLAMTQALVNQSDGLDPSGLAALALALHLGGDTSNANLILDKLISKASDNGSTAHWPFVYTSGNGRVWQTMPSNDKYTAFAMRALATVRPTHPLLPKAVRWLLEHRRGAGWYNTQATAFAVLGLLDVIKANGELGSNYSYNVILNDATIASGQVTPQNATQPITPVAISGAALRVGDNSLRIERSAGAGVLYYSLALNRQLYFDGFTPVASVGQGLTIARSYRLVEGNARPPVNGIPVYGLGDLVEVDVTVSNLEELWYVLIQDPIPAGFEVVEERMNPSTWYGGYADAPFFWRLWGYNQKEIRDDRVEYFVTQLWPGPASSPHHFTYLMRATTPGQFSVLPGTATPMYNESLWARSASQQVIVAPEQLASRSALLGDFDNSCQLTTFDTRLAALAWSNGNASQDLTADGKFDLRDVAAVGSRVGGTCANAAGLPGSAPGQIDFAITVAGNQQLIVGDEISVTVSLNALAAGGEVTGIDGFAVTLAYDARRLQVSRAVWHSAVGTALPLGPRNEAIGRVQVGIYDLPANLAGGEALVTLVLRGSGVGAGSIQAIGAEAVNGSGQSISANVVGNGSVQVAGRQLFLPVAGR